MVYLLIAWWFSMAMLKKQMVRGNIESRGSLLTTEFLQTRLNPRSVPEPSSTGDLWTEPVVSTGCSNSLQCVSSALPKICASFGCFGFTVVILQIVPICSHVLHGQAPRVHQGPNMSQHNVRSGPVGVPAIAIWLEKEGKPRPKQRPVQPT